MQFNKVSIEEFILAIQMLPKHKIRDQWLRWLSEYDEPGYYNRLAGQNYSAKFAYNHLANPEMLLWLAKVAGIDQGIVKLAREDSESVENIQKKCAAIRKHIPWGNIESALWR